MERQGPLCPDWPFVSAIAQSGSRWDGFLSGLVRGKRSGLFFLMNALMPGKDVSGNGEGCFMRVFPGTVSHWLAVCAILGQKGIAEPICSD